MLLSFVIFPPNLRFNLKKSIYALVIYSSFSALVWAIVLLSSIASVPFVIGFVFIPKTKEDGATAVSKKDI